MRMPMIVMTTSSSTRVNPPLWLGKSRLVSTTEHRTVPALIKPQFGHVDGLGSIADAHQAEGRRINGIIDAQHRVVTEDEIGGVGVRSLPKALVAWGKGGVG